MVEAAAQDAHAAVPVGGNAIKAAIDGKHPLVEDLFVRSVDDDFVAIAFAPDQSLALIVGKARGAVMQIDDSHLAALVGENDGISHVLGKQVLVILGCAERDFDFQGAASAEQGERDFVAGTFQAQQGGQLPLVNKHLIAELPQHILRLELRGFRWPTGSHGLYHKTDPGRQHGNACRHIRIRLSNTKAEPGIGGRGRSAWYRGRLQGDNLLADASSEQRGENQQ